MYVYIHIYILSIIFGIFELFQRKRKKGSRGANAKFTQFTDKGWPFDPWFCFSFTKRLDLTAFSTDEVVRFMRFYLMITFLLSVCFHSQLVSAY